MSATVRERATAVAIGLAERGRLPDPMIRAGVRRLLEARLQSLDGDAAARDDAPAGHEWSDDPERRIAVETDAANQQHYEVPAEFFRTVLGPHLKYSCCQWTGADGETDAATLAQAERRMIDLSMRRAELEPGQRVLDLGCGWGSFSLHAAAAYPESRFLAVSNSRPQIEFIRDEARSRRLANLDAAVADVNGFTPDGRFDRIVSIEMMEHVRDHPELMRRIADWLAPEGRLFVHVFCHRSRAYAFEAEGPGDWMARQFFTGGIMPSIDTIPEAAAGILETERRWTVSGAEYARTADAWLTRLDAGSDEAREILRDAGEPDPELAVRRWRLFFLAVSETFGYRGGDEWQVGHYRLRPESTSGGDT